MRGMGKQTHKRLSKQVAASADALPRYDERHGWVGGDDRTLYAFTDERAHKTIVRPVYQMRLAHAGPCLTVRIATREEATCDWQDPLHPGWKVEG